MQRVNAAFRANIPEANVFAFPPPAIQGLGTGGGFSFWLQDRSGGSDRVSQHEPPEVPGGSAQETRARQRQQRLAPQRAPDLRRHQPGQGSEAGRRRQRRLPVAAGVPGRHLRQPVQPFRPAVEGLPAGRRRRPRAAVRHQPVLRPQQRRADGASLLGRDHPEDRGPRVHQSLQPVPGGAGHRNPRARLQLGSGHGGARRGREASPPARDGLRLGRHVLPGSQGRGCGREGFRALDRLRFPDPRRALRELVAALQRSSLRARRGLRRLPRAPPAQVRSRRLRADRPRHAHRPGRQERDPDRRVRRPADEGRQDVSSTRRSRARSSGSGRSS